MLGLEFLRLVYRLNSSHRHQYCSGQGDRKRLSAENMADEGHIRLTVRNFRRCVVCFHSHTGNSVSMFVSDKRPDSLTSLTNSSLTSGLQLFLSFSRVTLHQHSFVQTSRRLPPNKKIKPILLYVRILSTFLLKVSLIVSSDDPLMTARQLFLCFLLNLLMWCRGFFLVTNVLIVSCFGQKHLLNVNININTNIINVDINQTLPLASDMSTLSFWGHHITRNVNQSHRYDRSGLETGTAEQLIGSSVCHSWILLFYWLVLDGWGSAVNTVISIFLRRQTSELQGFDDRRKIFW